jgi:hypothetical protein
LAHLSRPQPAGRASGLGVTAPTTKAWTARALSLNRAGQAGPYTAFGRHARAPWPVAHPMDRLSLAAMGEMNGDHAAARSLSVRVPGRRRSAPAALPGLRLARRLRPCLEARRVRDRPAHLPRLPLVPVLRLPLRLRDPASARDPEDAQPRSASPLCPGSRRGWRCRASGRSLHARAHPHRPGQRLPPPDRLCPGTGGRAGTGQPARSARPRGGHPGVHALRRVADHLLPGERLWRAAALCSEIPPAPETLRISFQTPLRLKGNDQPVSAEGFTFGAFFSNLLRRISLLSYFHTDTPSKPASPG